MRKKTELMFIKLGGYLNGIKNDTKQSKMRFNSTIQTKLNALSTTRVSSSVTETLRTGRTRFQPKPPIFRSNSVQVSTVKKKPENPKQPKKLFDDYSFYIYPRLSKQVKREEICNTIEKHGGELLRKMSQKSLKSKVALLYNPLATNNLELMLRKHRNPLHIFDVDFDELVLRQELKDSVFKKNKKF